MIEEINNAEYIDVKDNNNEWKVGKIISKEGADYKIRFEGQSARFDTVHYLINFLLIFQDAS